jgi:transcriptional regulator GlxA family with amidase domain
LFDTPLADLYQRFVPISSLAGNRFNWLFCLIREAPDMQSRVAIATSFLQKKLLAVHAGNDLLTKAIRKIWMEEGNISTACLSKSVFIGERQLQRLFKNSIGISPKLYSRIVRFRSAYEQAQSGRQMAWADVAYSLGYADQAHFVKDFKNFAGVTPTALFN